MQLDKQTKHTLLDVLAFTLTDLKDIEYTIDQAMDLLGAEIDENDMSVVIKDLIISLDKTKQLHNITDNLNKIIKELKHVRAGQQDK